jgi:hypothetical protein
VRLHLTMRFSRKEEARQIMSRLRNAGHEISNDWTKHPEIGHINRNYDEHPEEAQRYAVADLDGAMNADVLIVVPEQEPVGPSMHVELGAAICHQQLTGRPQIYVVGEGRHGSLMYFHPAVKRRESIDDVLAELG